MAEAGHLLQTNRPFTFVIIRKIVTNFRRRSVAHSQSVPSLQRFRRFVSICLL